MGKLGPDGIDESTKLQVEIPEVDAYDATVSPAEPALQETTETLPELTLENFAQGWASQSPDEAMKLFGALQREIYEAFGIAENNPDAIDLEAQSRIEALAQAVQSNQPEEIEQSLNSLFDGSIDSPARLNELAGLMIGQGGGNFEGLSIGGKSPLSEEQLKARRDQERTANAAAIASAQAAIAAVANEISNFFDNNKEFFNALFTDVAASGGTEEEKGVALADGAEQQLLAEYERLKEQYPDAPDEQIIDMLAEQFGEEIRDSGLFSDKTADTAELTIRERIQAYRDNQLNFTTSLKGDGLSLIAGVGLKLNPTGGSIDLASIQTKDDLNGVISNMFDRSDDQIFQSYDQLNVLTQAISDQRLQVEAHYKALENSLSIDEAIANSEAWDQAKQELAELEEMLVNEREILSLREEVSELARAEVDKLLEPLNDDLSNLDVNFLKNAFLEADPMLMQKGMELNAKMGISNEGGPMAEMLDLARNQLSAEDFAELEQFMNDVAVLGQQKQTALEAAGVASDKLALATDKLTEAEAYEAELKEALGDAWADVMAQYHDSDFAPAVGPASGSMSPAYSAEQEVYYLEQERREQLEQLNTLRAEATELQAEADAALFEATKAQTMLDAMKDGKTLEEAQAIADALEPPKPPEEPTEEVVAEDIVEEPAATEETWDRSNYSYLEEDANRLADEILASGEPISMEQLEAMATHDNMLGAYGENGILMLKAVLEEKAPAYEFSDGPLPAHYVELNVVKEIYDDISLDSISKEEIMNRLADAGLSGEQLAASTEQVIADIQTDIGMDFVTGLNWPSDNADAVYGADHTLEEEMEEPTPVANNEGPAPTEQDYAYNTNSPGVSPV